MGAKRMDVGAWWQGSGSQRDYWLTGRPVPFADVRPDLSDTRGLRPVVGGVGESVSGGALMSDPWVTEAMARLGGEAVVARGGARLSRGRARSW